MRVLYFAGYSHPAYHRKIELLADSPDVEIVHVTIEGYGRQAGRYPSANGQRCYRVRTLPAHYLGKQGDPHRGFLFPPYFGMREFKPDIVQIESDVETLGTAQVVLARALLAPQSLLVGYSWQNILRPRRAHVRLLSNLNLRAANHVICASTEAANVLRAQGYCRGTSIMPVSGVDRRYFNPHPVPELRKQLGLQDNVVGYVGRLAPEKGVDTLLQAAALVSAPIHVLILGEGEDEPRLRNLASTLGIAERCVFHKSVEYDRVADYMNAMDILVLPSRTTTHWKEQFGRVLVEAMACKSVVVGSDSGAIPEVIGKPEQVFPEGNSSALASILDDLTRHPERRLQTSELGYARVIEQYTVERLADRLLDVWRGIYQSKPTANAV